MIATPTTMPTFTANRTTTIAPSTPPTMAMVTKTLMATPTTTLTFTAKGTTMIAPLPPPTMATGTTTLTTTPTFTADGTTSGMAAPPGGTFLALDNYCDDGGDAAGKARGMAEDGGGEHPPMTTLMTVVPTIFPSPLPTHDDGRPNDFPFATADARQRSSQRFSLRHCRPPESEVPGTHGSYPRKI